MNEPIKMPDTVAGMPPEDAWNAGRCQGVNHVLAWLGRMNLGWAVERYMKDGGSTGLTPPYT